MVIYFQVYSYIYQNAENTIYSKQLLLLLQSTIVARYLLIVKNVGFFLQIYTQTCMSKKGK